MITGRIAIRTVLDGIWAFAEHVPNTSSTTDLVGSTFNLVGRGRDAPHEVIWERHYWRLVWRTLRLQFLVFYCSMTNSEVAEKLRDLRDFLIIAGYEESHATRYTQIARYIEKLPEAIEDVKREGRLQEVPGVGKLVAQYIREIMEDGVSSKQKEWEAQAPITVLELVRIPGLGPKTARKLFQEYGIENLSQLKLADESGVLAEVQGVGPKLIEAVRAHIAAA